MLFRSYSKKNGFTMIEILIAITIFSIMITIAIGLFISSIRIQRFILNSQQLLAQTSYAMEYMGRLIRIAKKDIDGNCVGLAKTNYDPYDSLASGSQNFIYFVNYHEKCQKFYLENGRIYQETAPDKNRANLTDKLALTSDDLEVTDFKFYVSGGKQKPTDQLQPRVTIILNAEVKNVSPQPKIKLQTTVSQRDLDIKE